MFGYFLAPLYEEREREEERRKDQRSAANIRPMKGIRVGMRGKGGYKTSVSIVVSNGIEKQKFA